MSRPIILAMCLLLPCSAVYLAHANEIVKSYIEDSTTNLNPLLVGEDKQSDKELAEIKEYFLSREKKYVEISNSEGQNISQNTTKFSRLEKEAVTNRALLTKLEQPVLPLTSIIEEDAEFERIDSELRRPNKEKLARDANNLRGLSRITGLSHRHSSQILQPVVKIPEIPDSPNSN